MKYETSTWYISDVYQNNYTGYFKALLMGTHSMIITKIDSSEYLVHTVSIGQKVALSSVKVVTGDSKRSNPNTM